MFFLKLFSDGTVREFPRPTQSYKVCGYTCHVYGCIKHIVDYEELAYLHPSDDLVEEILYKYLCVDGSSSEWLTKLSGSFFLVILKNDRLFQLITSNDFRMGFYFRNDQTGVRIHTDYTQLLPDVIKEDDIDVSSLDYFARNRNCYLGNTYILGLERSLPYTIYFLKDGDLAVQAHYFYASHRSVLVPDSRRYSVEDYLSVAGRALSADTAYSLAYSSGVDSHHLLMQLDGLISDLGVVYYQAPYCLKTSKKNREVVASVVNAVVHSKPIHIVACDFNDPQLIEYMKDAVIRSPFTHHLAVHFYQLLGELESDDVLTGQNADSVWCFGYSRVTWNRFLRPIIAHPRSWVLTWWPRILAALSDVKLRDSARLEKALKVKFRDIPHDNSIDGYALLILAKALIYFPSGDSISWHNAASYHGKTIYHPYCEPLVLHVASRVKRRFSPDPKSQLRPLVCRYGDENVRDEVFQHIEGNRPWGDANLFAYFEDLILTSPYMKRYQPIIQSIPTRIARIYVGYFLYRFGDRDPRGEEILDTPPEELR